MTCGGPRNALRMDMGPESVFYASKKMATHSSILAWKILWTEEPGGLQSIGLQRVRRDGAASPHGAHNMYLLLWQRPGSFRVQFVFPLGSGLCLEPQGPLRLVTSSFVTVFPLPAPWIFISSGVQLTDSLLVFLISVYGINFMSQVLSVLCLFISYPIPQTMLFN